jgi:hypothetical protein
MILFELLVLAVVAIFIANGMRAGAIETLGRVVGAVLGFLAAKAWSGWLIVTLSLFLPITWAFVAGFIIIFLVVDSLVGFLFRLADGAFSILTRLPVLKQIDSAAGAVLGAVESVIIIGGVAFLLRQTEVVPAATKTIIGLQTVTFIEHVFRVVLGFLL